MTCKKFCTNIYTFILETWSEMKGVWSKIIGHCLFSVVQNKQTTHNILATFYSSKFISIFHYFKYIL
jgi:hypothetical protein